MKKVLIILISILMFIITVLLAIGVGSVNIPVNELLKVLLDKGDMINKSIIVDIRLPRVLIAALVGANLAVSGALLQSVMKNPLADPGIIGVSSGASLGAIIIMLIVPQYTYLVPLFAFFGGVLATFLIFILAWKQGIKPVRIILSGVAINAMLGGATSLISVLNSDKIQGILMWINGSISGRSWNDLNMILVYSIIGLILSYFCIRPANILLLSDEKAVNLGFNVNRSRVLLSLLGAFLAGISTSVVGVIGFIGLVIPHISRLVIGSDYKYLLPLSMIGGATMLLLADTFARIIAKPIELPVGTIMAVIGGPFFLYLLRRGGDR
ncbi:FecCD family ABC transporter permease [Caldisalinibacter kiritimatiensis]|uniref:Heme transporter IsdDEF, permease component IsdF n=1 Tax=Caldisalinibacter kiritimatiensis TaxID=1304284 RepID=R1ATZ0_9FIRM|nr:iron ABC transporter permease [Caldisalinibacter kiritimatiensis]EOD00137.1 Heme transporter IsdDEF, permease component IsdF [Caldisalinibacter kiritimatiensis]